jgi:hypothetical protein
MVRLAHAAQVAAVEPQLRPLPNTDYVIDLYAALTAPGYRTPRVLGEVLCPDTAPFRVIATAGGSAARLVSRLGAARAALAGRDERAAAAGARRGGWHRYPNTVIQCEESDTVSAAPRLQASDRRQ